MNKGGDNNSDDEFFDYSKFNTEAANEATADLAEYIDTSGDIAIYDGLNITVKERQQFESQIKKLVSSDYHLIWVESYCDDKQTLINNFQTTRENYEEYKNLSDEEVYNVFEDKIQNLKEQNETLNKETDNSFIKIVNMGKSVEIVNVGSIRFINIIKFL
jgi:6-phosphofructo-2-kinase/fructose-2,6-biphosphatase 2